MASNVFAATVGFSSGRENSEWPGSGTQKSNTRAIAAAKSNNKLKSMKTIFETAIVAREAIPLREVIPFWFAVSSPLIGAIMGLLGAWFVTWLSA
jgi:hypothetical protein